MKPRGRGVWNRWRLYLLSLGWALLAVMVFTAQGRSPAGPSVTVGLIAPLSGNSAASGEAIQRGMLLAMDEVNQAGGVLGRPLALVVRDVPNDPPAGVAALRELVQEHAIVAIFGGIFSPVMLAQLGPIHQLQLPLINAWGSLTAITHNGRTPNYAYRVAANDEQADEFLARYALSAVGAHRPGIIADTTAWGEANVAGLLTWFMALGVPAIVRGMVTLNWQVPVVSHWGISGGRFATLAGFENAEGILVLQTFSFHGPLPPKAAAVLRAYHARFGTHHINEVLAPVGVAHGYDGLHLLVQAIRQAQTTEGLQIRDALEHLAPYNGLVKRYAPAFTPERHDPLLVADYLMAIYRRGRLVPAPQPRIRP